ncbi:MAG: deoxyribose-phosphate aldolase [Saccharofermentanales bacterium]|jgi:deoxyribose-phosphate aldolase
MKAQDAARLIDISCVRTHNTYQEIFEMAQLGKKYGFINVHVLPAWVSTLVDLMKDVDNVYVGAPVGFPGGGHKSNIKLLEAKSLIDDGVQEMDIVMNVGKFKSKEYDYVFNELKDIIEFAQGKVRRTKVIIEINALNDEEMLKACQLVIDSGADYIKTGTGWIPGDANIERVKLIKQYCKDQIKVKVAGGIRTREDFINLIDLGVERMGINTKSAIEIVESFI